MRICNSSPKSMLLNVARGNTPYFDCELFPLNRKAEWLIPVFSSKFLDPVSGVLDGPLWVGTHRRYSLIVRTPLRCSAGWWFVSALPTPPSPRPSVLLVKHPPCLSLRWTIVGEGHPLESHPSPAPHVVQVGGGVHPQLPRELQPRPRQPHHVCRRFWIRRCHR